MFIGSIAPEDLQRIAPPPGRRPGVFANAARDARAAAAAAVARSAHLLNAAPSLAPTGLMKRAV